MVHIQLRHAHDVPAQVVPCSCIPFLYYPSLLELSDSLPLRGDHWYHYIFRDRNHSHIYTIHNPELYLPTPLYCVIALLVQGAPPSQSQSSRKQIFGQSTQDIRDLVGGGRKKREGNGPRPQRKLNAALTEMMSNATGAYMRG